MALHVPDLSTVARCAHCVLGSTVNFQKYYITPGQDVTVSDTEIYQDLVGVLVSCVCLLWW